MNDVAQVQQSSTPPRLEGELRRLPAPLGWRLFEAATFVLFFRAALAGGARYLLRYHRSAELELHQQELRLLSTRCLLGVQLGKQVRSFALDRLDEVALETQGEDLRFAGGLGALFLGTFLGVWLLTDAATTSSGSLFIVALLLLTVGIATDYLVGSGRTFRSPAGVAQLTVVSGRRGFVLSAVRVEQARLFLKVAQDAISDSGPVQGRAGVATEPSTLGESLRG